MSRRRRSTRSASPRCSSSCDGSCANGAWPSCSRATCSTRSSRVRPDRDLRLRPADRAGDHGAARGAVRRWAARGRGRPRPARGRGRQPRARASCANVPGVELARRRAAARATLDLTVAPGSDPAAVRSAVLAVVAAEGLPLASIRAVVPSLEDVYRRAVARPATAGAARPRPSTEDMRRRGSRAARDASRRRAAAGPRRRARPGRARHAPVRTPAGGRAMSEPRPAPRTRSVPGSGWTVVAAKEFGDHLLSARFFVLVIMLGAGRCGPAVFRRGRDPGGRVEASPTTQAHLHRAVLARPGRRRPDSRCRRSTGFLAYVAPLLGLAFSFDCDQRRARPGNAAATALPADPPRRRRQRQVRGRARGHRAGPRHGRRRDRGVRR